MAACPTPSKAGFADSEAAQRAAARIRYDQRGPALEPYRCSCGRVHLTSGSSLTHRIRSALGGKS